MIFIGILPFYSEFLYGIVSWFIEQLLSLLLQSRVLLKFHSFVQIKVFRCKRNSAELRKMFDCSGRDAHLAASAVDDVQGKATTSLT